MGTTIICAPAGIEDTVCVEDLRKHFECKTVVDGWGNGDKLVPHALHLSRDPSLKDVVYICDRVGTTARVILWSTDIIKAATATSSLDGGELPAAATKDTNPKDSVGVRKWRQFTTVPMTVISEVGVAMLEGHKKGYGRHNYRVAGVRASVYVDAAIGHVAQWWEGEDIDADSNLSHVTKAIASLVVLRDAMLQDMLTDDRPPKAKLDAVRDDLQKVVDQMFERYPEAVEAYTERGEVEKKRLRDLTTVTIDASKICLTSDIDSGITRDRPVK